MSDPSARSPVPPWPGQPSARPAVARIDSALPAGTDDEEVSPWCVLLQEIPGGWPLALGLLVTLRVALGLLAIMSLHLQSLTAVGGDWLNLLIRSGRLSVDLLAPWQRWDALWYQQIATHGYHAGDGTVAFQPLYPLIARIVSVPLLGNVVLAELLVSSAAFFGAMWLLYRITLCDAEPFVAKLAVLITALFPVGFFLLVPYTESLFLLLSLAAFWFARSDRPWLAGLAGMGAGLTRTFGAIFLVLPLAFEYVRQRHSDSGPDRSRVVLRPGFGLLAPVLPAAGLLAMTLYQKLIVGEQRSIFEVQSFWGNRVVPPWHPVPDSISHIVRTGDNIEMLNLLCLLGFGVLALFAIRRLPVSYSLYTVPYLAFMFSRESLLSPLESVARYLLILFPCVIMLAIWLARRPLLAAAWLVVSVLLQALLLEYWVHFGFVG